MTDFAKDPKCNRCIKNELAQLVIDTLYGASEPEEALHSILAFVGSWYDLSRVYLVDITNPKEQNWTYGWTARSARGGLRDEQIHRYELLGFYRNIFRESPMLVIDDFSKADERTQKAMGYRQAKSILQYAFMKNDQITGFLGMDDCEGKRIWSQEEKDCIRMVAKVAMEIFCKREAIRGGEETGTQAFPRDQQEQNALAILEHMQGAAYVMDLNTHEVLYINRYLKDRAPQVKLGDICYEALYERKTPCRECPKNTDRPVERHNERTKQWLRMTGTPIPWGEGRQAKLIQTLDITEQHCYREHLEKMAYEDALLGIPNREGCKRMAHKNIRRALKSGAVILMLDIRNFKQYNDRFGYEYGDAILRELLRYFYSIGLEGKIFRWGGDDFIIELMGYSQQMALEVAEQILERMKKPFDVLGIETQCHVDIALAMTPEQGETADEVISNLEYALAQAKRHGLDGPTIFSMEFKEQKRREEEIVKILQTAAAQNKLSIYFQPIFDVNGYFTDKMETLVRLYDENLGFISPEEFIPIAEQTGAIREISQFALEQICIKMKQLQAQGIHYECIGMNLSPSELVKTNCAENIIRIVEEQGGDLSRLCIEVTEHMLIGNEAKAKRMMDQLKQHGVRMVLDDFGRGYTSFPGLINLPLYAIKIDRSMLTSLQYPTTRVILKGVISTAKKMGLRVVCEGVETEEQLNMVLRAGCDSIQGFYFSRPVPEKEINALLIRHAKGRTQP